MFGDAWDDMSSEYDNCVENNPSPVISDFIEEEIRIISNICKIHPTRQKKYNN